jgi:hypothetical protein
MSIYPNAVNEQGISQKRYLKHRFGSRFGSLFTGEVPRKCHRHQFYLAAQDRSQIAEYRIVLY